VLGGSVLFGLGGGAVEDLVLSAEGQVDLDQRLFLLLADVAVGEDLAGEVRRAEGASRMPAWT